MIYRNKQKKYEKKTEILKNSRSGNVCYILLLKRKQICQIFNLPDNNSQLKMSANFANLLFLR